MHGETLDDGVAADDSMAVEDRPAWRDGAEVLAVLLVVGVAGLIGEYLFTGLATREATDPAGSWSAFLWILAQGGSPVPAGLVALALALVVFTPGVPGRSGRIALNAISVVGVLVATLAVLGLEEALRTVSSPYGAPGEDSGPGELYVKLGAACLWLPSFAIAGYSAFTAWRTLNAPAPSPRSGAGPGEDTEPELEPDADR